MIEGEESPWFQPRPHLNIIPDTIRNLLFYPVPAGSSTHPLA